MCFTVSQQKKGLEIFIKDANLLYEDNQIKNLLDQVQNNFFVSGFQYPGLVILKENEVDMFNWGLIPFWTKTAEDANNIRSMTLNARSETIFEKPSYSSAIKTQRCILPVDGYFEWKEVNNEKITHYIFPKESSHFYFGCLYDRWIDHETRETKNTFSIITVPSNPMMTEIHNSGQNKHRMPLIISEKDIEQWNDPSLKKENIEKLMEPFNEHFMDAYTISKKANYSRENRNVPEILQKVQY